MVAAPGPTRCGAATSTIPPVVPPRVAFAIGRDVGSAVVRNRLRRRLRALAGDRVAGTPLLPHGHLLIGARPGAGERSFDELGVELTAMLAARRSGHGPVTP